MRKMLCSCIICALRSGKPSGRFSQAFAAIGALLSGLAIILVFKQIKEMKKQFYLSSRSENSKILLYLHEYLSRNEYRDARRHIKFSMLGNDGEIKHWLDWTNVDKKFAYEVCSCYDQAGFLLLSDLVDDKTRQFFLRSSWGESIKEQYKNLSLYLQTAQSETDGGPPSKFFKHFVELHERAQRLER